MRLFKKIVLGLLIIIVLLAISGFIYVQTLKPQYSGILALAPLESEVTVYNDEFGVPHIYADSQQDAYKSLGYLHAQERLWQMELMKRIAPGRLSEILGKDLLKTDKFFVTLGIDDASEKAVKALDTSSEAYQLSAAYIAGVNQFIKEGATPIEFTLVGVEKAPYTMKDMYNIFGYMAFSFAMAQKTDPMLTAIQEHLGADYLMDLDVSPSAKGTLIRTQRPDSLHLKSSDSLAMKSPEVLSTDIAGIMKRLPIPAFIGSNSWVAGPQKTKSGKVLFANDPHIGYAQPSVWYEAHLVAPDYEMYGYHLAGVPFPLLGHNRDYAYGLTMFENDDIDFYKESQHPTEASKYKTPRGWANYKTYTRTIKVKDEEPVTIEVKTTRHGPIMNGIQDEITGAAPIAMSWVYTQHESQVLEAVYGISHAQNMEDFKAAVALIHAPGLNVMYGDAKNNIAWWASGKLYTHKDHVNPKFILDGASGEDDPQEYLDFEWNPKAENPEWNYVYSANNQPDSIAGMLYPGYYLPEDRGRRIVELLEPKHDWTRDDFKTMINDVESPVAKELVALSLKAIDQTAMSDSQKTALTLLEVWDGKSDADAVAPTIYQRFIYRYLENTFKDELDETLFNQLLKTHLLKRAIAIQMQNETSLWWDDVNTKQQEGRAEILRRSFTEAVGSLETQLGADVNSWTWGKVHTLEHPHALGAVEQLRPYFNVGPFEVGGTEEVLDNKAFDFNDLGLYPANAGPSTRRIVDFSDIENSVSILPTGQSGNPFSAHYDDQAALYNKGLFRKMKLNKEEIIESSRKLVLQPLK